jgi:hypothetical protein
LKEEELDGILWSKSLWKRMTTELLIRKTQIFLTSTSQMRLKVGKGKGHPRTDHEVPEVE